jgi:YD repeat-containing protein
MTALQVNSVTTNLKYNNLNELTKSTAVSPVSYAYDADGNLTSDGLHAYSYDVENRLVGVVYGKNDSTTFAYDGLGRRVAITETSGGITHYQWCGSRICRKLKPNGTTERNYYDEGEALPGQLIYYGPDQLGTPRNFALLKGKTATVEALDYDPFGKELGTSESPTQPDFRFGAMFYHCRRPLPDLR